MQLLHRTPDRLTAKEARVAEGLNLSVTKSTYADVLMSLTPLTYAANNSTLNDNEVVDTIMNLDSDTYIRNRENTMTVVKRYGQVERYTDTREVEVEVPYPCRLQNYYLHTHTYRILMIRDEIIYVGVKKFKGRGKPNDLFQIEGWQYEDSSLRPLHDIPVGNFAHTKLNRVLDHFWSRSEEGIIDVQLLVNKLDDIAHITSVLPVDVNNLNTRQLNVLINELKKEL